MAVKVQIDPRIKQSEIPTRLLFAEGMDSDTKLLWPFIASFGDKAFPGITAIGKFIHKSYNVTQGKLNALRDAKWIKWFSGKEGGLPNSYFLTTPELWDSLEPNSWVGSPTSRGGGPLPAGDQGPLPAGDELLYKDSKDKTNIPEPPMPPKGEGLPCGRAIALFCRERKYIKAYCDKTYKISGPDAGAIKRLLSLNQGGISEEEFLKALSAFFKATEFTGGHSLSAFANNFNKYSEAATTKPRLIL